MRVLVVDDDAGLRRSMEMILTDAGHEVATAASGEEGLRKVNGGAPEVVFADIRMPGMGGMEFLRRHLAGGGRVPVVVMTAYGSMEVATEALRAGAYDYLPKPFGADELLLALRKVEERERLRGEVARLRDQVRVEERFGAIVARSPGMIRALELASRVAPHTTSVLIEGETGTGKELLARKIHEESGRGGGFVAVNCGAVPEALLESEFFGHLRGAFTGADREREGLFQAASGGTLFLDEVGELPESLQVKLLRALQEGRVRRIGESEEREVDVRVVAATNRSLEKADGFRSDLYYRIAVVTLRLPPLRERPEEIPVLARHFLEELGGRMGGAAGSLSPAALEALLAHPWPGNVRELRNVLERALVVAEGEVIHRHDLPSGFSGEGRGAPEGVLGEEDDLSVKRRLAALERRLIVRALERTGGRRGEAAELLELSERALRYKIRDYGIE